MEIQNGRKMSTRVTFECRGCDLSTKSYAVWRRHLLKESHQEHARERMRSMFNNTKKRTVPTIVVFGTLGVVDEVLLKHFGDVALVTDFVFWRIKPIFCIVTLLSSQFLELVLGMEHIIQNKKMILRNLKDISEPEWLSICPFAVQPMEVDLTDDHEDPFNNESEYEDIGEESEEESKFSRQSNGNNAKPSSSGIGSLKDEKHFENEIQMQTLPQSISDDEQPSPISAVTLSSAVVNNGTLRAPKMTIILKLENTPKATKKQWFELFRQFNARVWPVCFKVNLYDLVNKHKIPIPKAQLIQPFKGDIMKSKYLNWAKSFCPEEQLQIIFEELYTRLEDNTIETPNVLPASTAVINLTGKLFTFDCEVKRKASRKSASIIVHFTKFHNRKTSLIYRKNFRASIYNMYKKLWSSYCRSRMPQIQI